VPKTLTILKPFASRDFALLWAGYAISMLGDGIFMVAISWQALALSNSAATLGYVWLAWTAVHLAALLFSGSLVDRANRKTVLFAAALAGVVSMGGIGILSVSGHLKLWELLVLAGVFGGGEAFFGPAFNAIIPDLVSEELLPAANSVRQFIRPFVFRLAGPALGGVLIASTKVGVAFLVDAGSFVAVILALTLMRTGSVPAPAAEQTSLLRSTREGFAYVRSQPWLWQALCVFVVTTALELGPLQVLVPFFVKNDLHQNATGLGIYFAAGGAGALIASWTFASKGMPGRPVRVLYAAWTASGLFAALIGTSATLWQALVFGFLAGGAAAAQIALWYTMLQTRVDREFIGRVSSLDWLISSTFVPLSYALAAPLGSWIGLRPVIIGSGLVGAALTALMLARSRETA
jgi:MFS family permease